MARGGLDRGMLVEGLPERTHVDVAESLHLRDGEPPANEVLLHRRDLRDLHVSDGRGEPRPGLLEIATGVQMADDLLQLLKALLACPSRPLAGTLHLGSLAGLGLDRVGDRLQQGVGVEAGDAGRRAQRRHAADGRPRHPVPQHLELAVVGSQEVLEKRVCLEQVVHLRARRQCHLAISPAGRSRPPWRVSLPQPASALGKRTLFSRWMWSISSRSSSPSAR